VPDPEAPVSDFGFDTQESGGRSWGRFGLETQDLSNNLAIGYALKSKARRDQR